MTAFESEIALMSRKEMESLLVGIKLTVFGRDTAVFEGIGGVSKISEEEMTFFSRKTILTVRGNKLCIAHLGKGVAVVVGRLDGVEYGQK